MANWEIIKHLNLNVNAYWQDEAPRALGDPRDSMSGYVIVNTTVMARNLWEKLDLEFSIHNLFDRDYTYPSPPSTTPKDYPAPGISFVLGAKFRF
jgi:iron complex outermembrane receptor protein